MGELDRKMKMGDGDGGMCMEKDRRNEDDRKMLLGMGDGSRGNMEVRE